MISVRRHVILPASAVFLATFLALIAVAHADPLTPAVVDTSAGAAAMTHGAALAGMLLGLVSILRSILARLQPASGEVLDPTGWRARLALIISSAITLTLGVIDVLTGSRWFTLVPVVLTAIAVMWPAIDPPKGSKRADAVPAPVSEGVGS